jgi:hypothetical protein
VNLAVIAAIWLPASLGLALIVGAVIALRDARECCPHDVDVPDTVPAEWTVTA